MTGAPVLAAAVLAAWANAALHLAWADRPVYDMRGLAKRPSLARWPLLLGTLALVSLGLAGWIDGHATGVVAMLVGLALIRRAERAIWPGDTVVRLGKYAPAAAALGGWLVAWTGARVLGGEPSARAWDGAAGVVAAMYGLAAASKLQLSGVRWGAPEHMALLLAERAWTGPKALRRLRRALVASGFACRAVGVAGLGVELAMVGFVVPDARLALAAMIVLFNLAILLSLGYVEVEWTLVVVGVALGG
jgi:hypothetical protein